MNVVVVVVLPLFPAADVVPAEDEEEEDPCGVT